MSPTSDKNCFECKETTLPLCHVKVDDLIKLKDSTKKLLSLVEEIQSKTHCKNLYHYDTNRLMSLPNTINLPDYLPSVTDIIGASALKKLEYQTKALDTIYVEDEDDDCSVYKRLTRKCHCLNQIKYNDFIIHFNEETKHFSSSTLGEIIKNLRILKKFLYMGCTYTKNALLFLNEGLSDSSHQERVEITQGCAYADICNVFDEHSVIIMYISWPCKYPYYGDSVTQALTARFVYKLAQIEDGRRYLNFNSKITNDIKKVLKKKVTKLEFETLESLNAALSLLHPPMAQHINVTYYCKPVSEDVGNNTLDALINYRPYMTTDEVFAHLDLLANLSNCDHGKNELKSHLRELLTLFKSILIEYDSSEINIIITNILNNIVSKNMVKEEKEPEAPKTVIIADTATEATKMKNATIQIPIKKRNTKKINKSKIGLGNSPNKNKHGGRKVQSEWEPCHLINRSRKFSKDIRFEITVPTEKSIHRMEQKQYI